MIIEEVITFVGNRCRRIFSDENRYIIYKKTDIAYEDIVCPYDSPKTVDDYYEGDAIVD